MYFAVFSYPCLEGLLYECYEVCSRWWSNSNDNECGFKRDWLVPNEHVGILTFTKAQNFVTACFCGCYVKCRFVKVLRIGKYQLVHNDKELACKLAVKSRRRCRAPL